MSLPINIPVGYLSFLYTGSPNGITSENDNLITGQVDALGVDPSDDFIVGDTITVNKNNAIQLGYDGNTYYLVNTQDILYTEMPV